MRRKQKFNMMTILTAIDPVKIQQFVTMTASTATDPVRRKQQLTTMPTLTTCSVSRKHQLAIMTILTATYPVRGNQDLARHHDNLDPHWPAQQETRARHYKNINHHRPCHGHPWNWADVNSFPFTCRWTIRCI